MNPIAQILDRQFTLHELNTGRRPSHLWISLEDWRQLTRDSNDLLFALDDLSLSPPRYRDTPVHLF